MDRSNDIGPNDEQRLNERERDILRLTVKSFIDTAGPVGSRYLAKSFTLGLSPASIRNTLSDLEDLGYLDHPYTSAGRVPTELGYRTFVDELMESPELTPLEKQQIMAQLDQLMGDTQELLRESSRLLGRLSNLLGVVLSPRLATGVLERLEVVPLSSSRVMFVISVRGGLVKTIVLELESVLQRQDVDRVVQILNERLAGLTLDEIRRSFKTRLRDLEGDRTGIVRLVLDRTALLFSEQTEGRLRYAGTQNIVIQPEFQEPDELRKMIEFLENEDFVVHLLEDDRPAIQEVGRAHVSIGSENSSEQVDKCSIVTAHYRVGQAVGTVGVIGPTRMDYRRVMALVEGMAALLDRPADTTWH